MAEEKKDAGREKKRECVQGGDCWGEIDDGEGDDEKGEGGEEMEKVCERERFGVIGGLQGCGERAEEKGRETSGEMEEGRGGVCVEDVLRKGEGE